MKSSTQSPSDDLIRCTATALSKRLHSGEISPVDVIEATAARIEEVNPSVNALPILCLEQAHDEARAMTDQKPRAEDKGVLWGLPLAVKDYNDLAGVATTYGSPLFEKNIARLCACDGGIYQCASWSRCSGFGYSSGFA